MGILDSLKSTFITNGTNALGITSPYDSGKAQKNLQGFDQSTQNSQKVFENATNANDTLSGQLAGQNYMGGAQQSFNTQLDAYNRQQQALQNQQGASQMLYNQATGNTPSVADLQMQMGLGNANNQAQSAAYSQQGGISPGLTQRNLLNAQAMQNANIVGQGQIARAGEVTQAQQMYNNTLGNISNASANLGQTAAGLTSTQQGLGQFMYNQGQNNLAYQQQNAQMLNNANQMRANNLYNSQQATLKSQADAAKAQSDTMMNAASSLVSGGMGGGAAGMLKGMGGSKS